MTKYGESLVVGTKLAKLAELLGQTATIPGDIAEVGVYKGGSATVLAAGAVNSHVYLFDTFAGMPEHHTTLDGRWGVGSFGDTSAEAVQSLFADNAGVSVIKGVFPQETGHRVTGCRFRLVHLDVDNYGPYMACLEFFYPLVSPGGVIVFDDYMEGCCPGATAAVDEFFFGRERVTLDETAYVVKQ